MTPHAIIDRCESDPIRPFYSILIHFIDSKKCIIKGIMSAINCINYDQPKLVIGDTTFYSRGFCEFVCSNFQGYLPVVNSQTMKVVALISGGKDSCYSMLQCVAAGHEIVALANLCPETKGTD